MKTEKKQREAFALKREHQKLIEELGPENGWRLFIGISQYALDNKDPQFEGLLKILWNKIEQEIDTNISRYDAHIENTKQDPVHVAFPNAQPIRDSTVFYLSCMKAMYSLSDKDCANVFRAMVEFAYFGIEPDIKKLPSPFDTAWEAFTKPMISAQKRYDACVENGKKGAEFGILGAKYGKLGGRPRKKTEL